MSDLYRQTMPELFAASLTKGQQTKIRILEGAIESLAGDGADRTTYESVAVQADTSKQLVKKYFPRKDDLLIQSAIYIRARFQNLAIQGLAEVEGSSCTEMLRRYITVCFDWVESHHNHALVWSLFLHYCSRSEEHREHHSRLTQIGQQRLVKLIEAGIHHKEFKCPDPSLAAKLIQASITGALTTLGTEDLDVSIDAFKASIIDLCLTSVGVKT